MYRVIVGIGNVPEILLDRSRTEPVVTREDYGFHISNNTDTVLHVLYNPNLEYIKIEFQPDDNVSE